MISFVSKKVQISSPKFWAKASSSKRLTKSGFVIKKAQTSSHKSSMLKFRHQRDLDFVIEDSTLRLRRKRGFVTKKAQTRHKRFHSHQKRLRLVTKIPCSPKKAQTRHKRGFVTKKGSDFVTKEVSSPKRLRLHSTLRFRH